MAIDEVCVSQSDDKLPELEQNSLVASTAATLTSTRKSKLSGARGQTHATLQARMRPSRRPCTSCTTPSATASSLSTSTRLGLRLKCTPAQLVSLAVRQRETEARTLIASRADMQVSSQSSRLAKTAEPLKSWRIVSSNVTLRPTMCEAAKAP